MATMTKLERQPDGMGFEINITVSAVAAAAPSYKPAYCPLDSKVKTFRVLANDVHIQTLADSLAQSLAPAIEEWKKSRLDVLTP